MHLEKTTSEQDIDIDARDLMCPICMTIAEDPHITSCCRRVFCLKDANVNRYENGCPLCRELNYTFEPSSKHKANLDKLTIKCDCSERIIPQEYENHLERCSVITFLCPHRSCQEKNEATQYNSQQLVNHLARSHCDEVPVLGSTYVNKKSLEPYKKASAKYDDLVSTLYTLLYPKMIAMHLKSTPDIQETSAIFQCPSKHKLIEADQTKRKRQDGTVYSTPGFNCDVCLRSFPRGHSWHCSCSQNGFDKCVSCIVFQLYELDDETLKLAGHDNEEQQHRYRRPTVRNTVRLPRGLFRLLTGSIDEEISDTDRLALRSPTQNSTQQPNRLDGIDDDEVEVNLRED